MKTDMNYEYSIEDISKMTYITPRTLRNYIKKGILIGDKVGGHWKFTKDNVEALLSNIRGFSENERRVIDIITNKDNVMHAASPQQTCTVINYYCKSYQIAHKFFEKLMENISDVVNFYPPVSIDFDFYKEKNCFRLIIIANSDLIIRIFQYIQEYDFNS